MRVLGRVLAAAVVIGSFSFWVFAFSPWTDYEVVDQLEDPTFPVAAEPICARHRAAIDALPNAATARTAAERADTIDEANDHIGAMLAELRALPTGGERATRLVGLWLQDWDVFLADRESYTTELRSDPAERFTVSAKGGLQITRPIDRFAETNDMPSCATPPDVG